MAAKIIIRVIVGHINRCEPRMDRVDNTEKA